MPSALVTGATGLLGWHIASRLRQLGWEVAALVRSSGSYGALDPRGVTTLRGDVLDADAFSRAAQGRDVVFHCAAVIMQRGGWEAFRRVNVEGTLNAVAAARSSAARLLHVSSVAVYGTRERYRADGRPTSEDTPLVPLPRHSHYARSKRESEEIVLAAARAGDIWAAAIRPTVLYGVHDRQFVPRVGRLLRRGIAPIQGEGGNLLAVVHAGNVADAAVLAATSDAARAQAYNTANDFELRYADFVRLAALGLRRDVRTLPIPRWGTSAAGSILQLLERTGAFSGPVESAQYAIDFISKDNPFTSEKARSELGWRPRHDPEETVPAAFAWWRESIA